MLERIFSMTWPDFNSMCSYSTSLTSGSACMWSLRDGPAHFRVNFFFPGFPHIRIEDPGFILDLKCSGVCGRQAGLFSSISLGVSGFLIGYESMRCFGLQGLKTEAISSHII